MTYLRTGRKVGLHLYRQTGPNPSDWDPPVGTVFTEELAAEIVQAVNAAHDHEADAERRMAYADLRVQMARKAEAKEWERRLAEELQARDTERDETVNNLASDLDHAERENRRLTAELARAKGET